MRQVVLLISAIAYLTTRLVHKTCPWAEVDGAQNGSYGYEAEVTVIVSWKLAHERVSVPE